MKNSPKRWNPYDNVHFWHFIWFTSWIYNVQCITTHRHMDIFLFLFLNGAEWCIRKCINIERTWTQASTEKWCRVQSCLCTHKNRSKRQTKASIEKIGTRIYFDRNGKHRSIKSNIDMMNAMQMRLQFIMKNMAFRFFHFSFRFSADEPFHVISRNSVFVDSLISQFGSRLRIYLFYFSLKHQKVKVMPCTSFCYLLHSPCSLVKCLRSITSGLINYS